MTDNHSNTRNDGTDLTHGQRRYLQTIFDYFHDKGAWPKRRYLERTLIKEDLDAREIGASFTGSLRDSQEVALWNSDNKVALAVLDMTHCRGAQAELEAFIRALRFCVETYIKAKTDRDPEVTSLDMMIRLNMTSEMTDKVGELFLVESLPRSFKQDGIQWTMTIPHEIVRYRNVGTLDDYLAARPKSPPVTDFEVPSDPSANQQLNKDTRSNNSPSNEVFIVHGHDEAARETTARFIEKLGLRPIILYEQANAGNTIIEKFEQHAKVAFAVVLLTPDDVGGSATTPGEHRPRARQNVILELGFFWHALGRKHVCALYKGNVELPSDFQGVLYIPMDEPGAWKQDLAREIKAAGLPLNDSTI